MEQNPYIALYRKYRPATFADVYGQNHITTVLKSEVAQNKVSHAYLFCGSRGTGKTTCAKILAKAVNCENPVDGDPCGVCPSCLAAQTSFDITEMDAASNNGVDYIRALREDIVYPPSELKRRVFIIDEVHMLSASAFNALLKTLEEPPSHVLFILATTEINKIPATILSRCKRFDFNRIPPDIIAKALSKIAQAESINLTDGAVMLIARLAAGAMRDALSMLEIFPKNKDALNEDAAAELLGVVGKHPCIKLLSAVGENDSENALRIIKEAYDKSKDMSVLCSELGSTLRDMLIIKFVADPEKYIEDSASVLEELTATAKLFSRERILYSTEIIEDAQNRLSRNTFSRRVILETAVLKLCDVRLMTMPEALNARIAALEEKLSRASVNSEKPTVKEVEPEEIEKIETALEVEDTSQEKKSDEPKADTQIEDMTAYGEFLEELKQKNEMFHSFFIDGYAKIVGDTVVIFASPMAMFMIKTDEEKAQVAACLKKALGREVSFFIKDKNTVKENEKLSVAELLGEAN